MREVICVLRSGGEYNENHVVRLRDQLAKRGVTSFRCLSDVEVSGVERIPMKYSWPGWWAKMELFRPDLPGDGMLYMDLDTSIIGDVSDFFVDRLAIMRDVYRPLGLQSSLMFIPRAERSAIWSDWLRRTEYWMRRLHKGGDQAFLERHWIDTAARWQDLLPGAVVSYKANDLASHGAPEGAKVVIFHGKPRPWDVGW